MPEGLDFVTAAAIPLTGLTAYQALTEELCAKLGQTLFIPGGSGSFGQRMRLFPPARIGISYIQIENDWETLSGVDYIIDTLGDKEFDHKLSVLKENGRARRIGSFLCGRMGRSWRKSPRLLRQTTLFLRLTPTNLTFPRSAMLCNWWRAGILTEK